MFRVIRALPREASRVFVEDEVIDEDGRTIPDRVRRPAPICGRRSKKSKPEEKRTRSRAISRVIDSPRRDEKLAGLVSFKGGASIVRVAPAVIHRRHASPISGERALPGNGRPRSSRPLTRRETLASGTRVLIFSFSSRFFSVSIPANGGSGGGDANNLQRIRSSTLGQSAPSLIASPANTAVVRERERAKRRPFAS